MVEITSPLSFDPVSNTPLPGGLYDPKMGPIPGIGGGSPQQQSCPTCGRLVHDCTGHCGHIELVLPIYHPILLTDLLVLTQCICRNCFRFKCPPQQVQIMRAKYFLLQQLPEDGSSSSSSSSMDLNYHTMDTKLAAAMYEARERYPQSKSASTRAATEAIDQIIRSVDVTQSTPRRSSSSSSSSSSSYIQQLRTELCKKSIQYLQSIPKCHFCGIYSPKLRIDSSNKIFQVPLSKKYQQNNNQQSSSSLHTFPSAAAVVVDDTNPEPPPATTTYDSDDTEMIDDDDDEDDNDDDDDDENENAMEDANQETMDKTTNTSNERGDGTTRAPATNSNTAKGKQRDMYVPPTEILALVKRIYESDHELCQNIFSISSYEQYFLYCLAVLPNRFRPPMKVGGNANIVEHVQTSFYQQILQCNATLRDQIASITTDTQNHHPMMNAPVGSNQMTNSAYQTWIELQTAVNCYMDSSKDPKKTASMNVASGIRQILERKEGLFRKHMMGKRVNYACRSVISPDPYIGSNEIGLPKYFCTILTYPTYVTPMNVVALRNAVLRGPHHYPGARWVQLSSSGTKIDLSKMKYHQRQSIAAQLLCSNSRGPPTIVGRQLQDGDYVLMNRQVRGFLHVLVRIVEQNSLDGSNQCMNFPRTRLYLSCTTPTLI